MLWFAGLVGNGMVFGGGCGADVITVAFVCLLLFEDMGWVVAGFDRKGCGGTFSCRRGGWLGGLFADF